MDITIESMVVLMVAGIVALIVVGIASGQSNNFTNFLGSQSDSANCQLGYTQYKSKADCSPSGSAAEIDSFDGTNFDEQAKWDSCQNSHDDWYQKYCG